MLPATCILDHLAPQHTGRAVEVKEKSSAEARAVLEDEMPVQQHRLDFRQQVVMAIQVGPPRLHYSDIRIAEIVDRALEEILRRNEVGIEDWR